MDLAAGFEHIGTTRPPQWMLDQGTDREIFLSTQEIDLAELDDTPEAVFEQQYSAHRTELLCSIRRSIRQLDNAQLERIAALIEENGEDTHA